MQCGAFGTPGLIMVLLIDPGTGQFSSLVLSLVLTKGLN